MAKPSLQSLAFLVQRSVMLDGRRTSVRLERAYWTALDGIAKAENTSVSSVIKHIDGHRSDVQALASAIRVYCLVKK